MNARFISLVGVGGLAVASILAAPDLTGLRAQDFSDFGSEEDLAAEEESPSLLDAARQESALAELQLTNGQRSQIEEIVRRFDEQKQQLQQATSEQLRGITSISERLVKTAQLRREEREKAEEAQRQAEQEVLALLSEAQAETLKERAAALGADVAAGPTTESSGPSPANVGSGSRPGAGAFGGRSRFSSGSPSRASSRSSLRSSSRGPRFASFAVIETPAEVTLASAADTAPTSVETPAGTAVEAPAAGDAAAGNGSGASQPSGGDDESSGGAGEGIKPPQPASHVSFSFRNAPWPDVLQLFARTAGLTLNMRAEPPGDFSYYDDGRYTPEEAIDIMNRLLMQDNFLLVRHDRFLTVFDTSKGIPKNIVDTVSLDKLSQRGATELVRAVFPLDERDADKSAEEVRAFLGSQGQVTALPSASSLVVTDVAGNLLQVKEYLEPEPTLPGEEITFRNFALNHISAHDAEQIIKGLFPKETGVQDPGTAAVQRLLSRRRSWRGRGRSRFGRDNEEDEDRSSDDTQAGSSDTPVAVIVDSRTNSVFVRARVADMKIIEEAVNALDVEQNGQPFATSVARNPDEPVLRVYQLKDADVDDVIQTLQAMYTDAMFNEDDDRNAVHAFATEEQHRRIAQELRLIDGAAGGDSLAVISLGALSAYEAGSMISSLYLQDGLNGPTVTVDPSRTNLIVRGSAIQISQIRELMQRYGGGAEARTARGSGPVRRKSVSNPGDLARLIEQIWPATNANPIRVVPSDGQRQATPQRPPVDRSGRRQELPLRERTPSNTDAALRSSELEVVLASQVTGDSRDEGREQAAEETDDTVGENGSRQPANRAGGEYEPNESESPAAAPIVISVEDGELVIISQDEDALNRLEALIDRLTRSRPAATTRWKVFYLRSADAPTVATMLGQLLPASAAAAAPTGISIPGLAPQSLQIIPEERTNALFVTGPPAQVDDVERLLRVLDADSSELPGSLRDAVPQMIPVRYANVNEVAQIVRDVFQPLMQPPRSNNSRNGRRSFFARGDDDNSNGNNSSQNRVQLTLGVDTQTSQLVVSCNDSIFQQVENLVASLDQTAYEADRVVQIVPSDNGAMIAQTVAEMVPQVTVSTTTSPSRSSSTSTANGGDRNGSGRGANGDDAARRERIRAFFERMRQDGGGFRGRGGDSNGSRFGRRGGDRSSRGRGR